MLKPQRLTVALCVLALAGCGRASGPVAAPQPIAVPSTDIYLYRFGVREPSPAQVFNITNRAGYDNQPFWDGNSRILFTSIVEGQADIYQLNFETSAIGKVIDTPESEYSPAITPDGAAISVVRVERDSTQRLWRFPRDGTAPRPVLEGIKPVGYYAWLDSTTLALFVLGSPNALQIADTRTGVGRVVTTNIGRSLQRVPESMRASFLHRVADRWVLKTVSPLARADGSFEVDSIAVLPDSAEYVIWKSPTELYTAAGSRIYRMLLPSRKWEEAADLSRAGLRRISRLAISPDGSRLAVVADERTQ